MHRLSPFHRCIQQRSHLRYKIAKEGCPRSMYILTTKNDIQLNRTLTSFTRATHLTFMCFRSKASCRSLTTSWPTTFFTLNPLVHVRSFPESIADCSTGKENVNPRLTGFVSAEPWGSAPGDVYSVVACEVKNASTESAR